MAEHLFCWVSEIPARREADVRAFLQGIGNDFGPTSALPLASLGALHFASLTMYSPSGGSPLLFFECSIDKPFGGFVTALEAACRAALDVMYEGCDGYPAANGTVNNPTLARDRIAYLSSRKICRRPQLFHVGHPERPVELIRADAELRRSLDHELKTSPDLASMSAADALRALHIRANCRGQHWRARPSHPSWSRAPGVPAPLGEISWSKPPWPWARTGRAALLLGLALVLGVAIAWLLEPWVFVEAVVAFELLAAYSIVHYTSTGARFVRALGVSALLTGAVWVAVHGLAPFIPNRWWWSAGFLIVPVFLAIAYARIRFVLRPTAPPPPLPADTARALLETEDHPAHGIYNHVFGLSELRPGWMPVRLLRTWLVLRLLNLFYRVQFVKGQLVSVPTIHFAQWNMIHQRYLLFNVHYDGGADRYLDDFFESLAQGVGFIWFDTVRYPRVTDPRRLKLWVRESQTLPLVRYRAAVYDNLTVADINNNKYLRRGLVRPRARLAERWMARLIHTLPQDPRLGDGVERLLRRLAPID